VSTTPPGDDGSPGRLRPTSPGSIVGWAVIGLVGGWVLRGASVRWYGSAPSVSWAQPLALVLCAAILGATAYLTWRDVHVHHQRLDPHRAVNRLVLARASALAGAFVAGGYLGYALSWSRVDSDIGSQWAWRSAAAGLAGVAIVIAAVALERACRVRSDEPDA
jgi:hypothetical protein